MKKNKILAWVIITSLAIWTSAALVSANSDTTTTITSKTTKNQSKMPELTQEQKDQMEKIKTLFEKQKAWEKINDDEKKLIEEFKSNTWKWFGWKMWKWNHEWKLNEKENRFWFEKLTDEEKASLEKMTQEEKDKFFKEKQTKMEETMEEREHVLDKVLAWETLTSQEEKIKSEIIKQRAEMKVKKNEMKKIKAIFEKQKAWETLSDDEKKLIENYWLNKKNKNSEQ